MENHSLEFTLVDIEPGRFNEVDPLPSFSYDNPTFIGEDWSSKVTGFVVNPYNFDIPGLRVYALTYNAAGEINSGGFTFPEFVLSTDSAPVEIYDSTGGEFVSIEIYSTVYSLDDLEQYKNCCRMLGSAGTFIR